MQIPGKIPRESAPLASGLLRRKSMMDLTLSLMALIAGGFTIELFAATRAPMGHQDEGGLGQGAEEFHTGNPS